MVLTGWDHLFEAIELHEGDPVTGVTMATANELDLAFEKGRLHEPYVTIGLHTDEAYMFSEATPAQLIADGHEDDLKRVFFADDLANGKNIIFCATGISDSALLRGVKAQGPYAITYSVLMRAKSKTVRFIKASHNLQEKTIRLRSDNREHQI